MPRAIAESGRIDVRLPLEDKATLVRAAALKRVDLTRYILGNALAQARSDISDAETVKLSARDSLRVLRLLADPPAPPARLVKAAKAGFRLPRPRLP